MTTFYIADPHFGHANIIRFEDRPFEDVEQMNRWLIEAWNARVTDGDDVFVIGDFAYRSATSVKSIVEQLAGRKLTNRNKPAFPFPSRPRHKWGRFVIAVSQLCLRNSSLRISGRRTPNCVITTQFTLLTWPFCFTECLSSIIER